MRNPLFTNKNFFLLWCAQAVSQFGDGLTKVSLLWFVYDLTGSAVAMTGIGLIQTLPSLVLNPLIGVYLDRLPKQSIMVVLDLLRALFIALIPLLHGIGVLTLEILYGLVLMNAVASAAFGPTLVSFIPKIAKPSDLMAANAMIQSTANIGVLIGPAASGLLIALIQAHNVLWVNAGTFLLSAIFLLGIYTPLPDLGKNTIRHSSTLIQDLREGVRFVFVQENTLAYFVMLTITFTLGGSALAFTLPILTKHLQVGPHVLGYLWSTMGGGMLLASLGLTLFPKESVRHRLYLMTTALGIGGTAIYGLGYFQSLGWVFLFVGLAGASTAIFTPIIWSLVQELTPDYLLCRTLTILNAFGMASASTGMLVFGLMTDVWGIRAGMVGIGSIYLMTAILASITGRRYAQASSQALKTCPL